MNIPNALTVLRIALAAAFVIFILSAGFMYKVLAAVVFLLAAASDLLDGFIAKRRNQITNFGVLMDPIADKILVLSALLSFVQLGVVEVWMVIIIIIRDFAVTALRIFAFAKGSVMSADGPGKNKTVWQMSVIFAILLFLIFREGGTAIFGFWNGSFKKIYMNIIFILMSLTVVFTVVSGASYFLKNKEVYKDEKKD